MKEDRGGLKCSMSKPTDKIPLGRARSRWEDKIRIDI